MKGTAKKRTAGLATLALVTVAGLAPAAVLSPGRALASTAASRAPLWVTHQDVLKGGINAQVAASPDGSAVFVAGEMVRRTEVSNGVLWAYNATTGAPVWQDKYLAAANSAFGAVAVSPDGSTVYATGFAVPGHGNGNKYYLTAAFNAATGAMLWASTMTTVGEPRGMTVSPDGSVLFVAGNGGTVAYSTKTGATLWTVAAEAVAIAKAPDGSAVYIANTLGFGYRNRYTAYLTTALDAATGATMWSAQYDVPKGRSTAAAIAATSTGSAVIVTGTTTDATGAVVNFGTVAYNPVTGTRLWVHAYHNPNGASGAQSLAVSPDGSTAFVTGTTDPSPSAIFYGDYATVAYNTATGAPLWTARYHGPAAGYGGPVEDVAVSPDGAKVIVTGYNWSAPPGSQPQFATVAYDAHTGAPLWTARYGQPEKEPTYGISVAVSPDSAKVFVTGDTGNDGATVAYNS